MVRSWFFWLSSNFPFIACALYCESAPPAELMSSKSSTRFFSVFKLPISVSRHAICFASSSYSVFLCLLDCLRDSGFYAYYGCSCLDGSWTILMADALLLLDVIGKVPCVAFLEFLLISPFLDGSVTYPREPLTWLGSWAFWPNFIYRLCIFFVSWSSLDEQYPRNSSSTIWSWFPAITFSSPWVVVLVSSSFLPWAIETSLLLNLLKICPIFSFDEASAVAIMAFFALRGSTVAALPLGLSLAGSCSFFCVENWAPRPAASFYEPSLADDENWSSPRYPDIWLCPYRWACSELFCAFPSSSYDCLLNDDLFLAADPLPRLEV